MATPTEKPKITVAQAEADASVMVTIARALEPFTREQQLRIMEAACVLLREDGFAAEFRAAREPPRVLRGRAGGTDAS